MARVLVVDDEDGVRSFLSEALSSHGHEVVEASSSTSARALLSQQAFDVVVTDLKMPGETGLDLLRAIKSEQSEIEVVVLTAHGTIDTAVEAMKVGAFDYLQKPLKNPNELRLVVSRALQRRAQVGIVLPASGEESFPTLTFGASSMVPVVESMRKVARTNATVLLLGESGTGKEVAAQAIHAFSDRRAGPFVAVNCAALADTLLDSELFGHEKGAFTGAAVQRRGRIELADGGTFFLDEIGELKLDLQAKLLRVLQERRFERVGGTRTLTANVRWIAATNRDLASNVDSGSFREDLYHRLAVFPIHLPALRERREDIEPLTRVLLKQIAHELARPGLELEPTAIEWITTQEWPGNVRELRNALERAAILAEGGRIRLADVRGMSSVPFLEAARGGAQSLEELEREAIERALLSVSGNRKRAAEILGIGLRTLYDKLKRYGLG